MAEALSAGRSPWVDFIHLLWSAWVFVIPAFGDGDYGFTLRWLLLTALSYPLFLLLYSLALVRPMRQAWQPALALVALSMLLLPWYPSGFTYFVFGCVLLNVIGPKSLSRYLLALLALNLLFTGLAWSIGYPWQTLAYMAVITFVIGIIVRVEHESQRREAALKLSQDEVRRLAATAERERIGRDLHDLLGHTLSLITVKLELARKLGERDPAAARRELDDAERVAREALAQVRSAVTGYRATDLAAELASARLLLESSRVQFDYGPPPPDLPPELERGLALVLREAVTNIARHAQATRAQVDFQREPQAVELRIRDDGRGGLRAEGNGITGMRDRLRAFDGSLAIESPRGGGTCLRLRAPVTWPAPRPPLRAVPDAAPGREALP